LPTFALARQAVTCFEPVPALVLTLPEVAAAEPGYKPPSAVIGVETFY